jgi:hypothetical protein
MDTVRSRPEKDEAAVRIFTRIKDENEKLQKDGITRRLRATYDEETGKPAIDVSKANPECDRCAGGAILEERLIDIGRGHEFIPVICKCVSERGGVTPDKLDRQVAKAQRHLRRRKRARWRTTK